MCKKVGQKSGLTSNNGQKMVIREKKDWLLGDPAKNHTQTSFQPKMGPGDPIGTTTARNGTSNAPTGIGTATCGNNFFRFF